MLSNIFHKLITPKTARCTLCGKAGLPAAMHRIFGYGYFCNRQESLIWWWKINQW
jgi:hypothetical protein